MAGMTACGSDDHPEQAAANGLDGLSGEEIVAKAQAAGERAPSVRMFLQEDGAQGRTTIKAFAARSGDCISEVAQGDPIVDGFKWLPQRVELLRKGGQTWMKAPAVAGQDEADNKWIASRGSVGSQLFDTCELTFETLRYFGEMMGADAEAPWVREGVTRIGGVPVVLLHQGTGKIADELSPAAGEAESVQIAVAAEGEPYLLRLTYGAAGGATMLFSDYGAPVTVTPPPADQVRDYERGSLPN